MRQEAERQEAERQEAEREPEQGSEELEEEDGPLACVEDPSWRNHLRKLEAHYWHSGQLA